MKGIDRSAKVSSGSCFPSMKKEIIMSAVTALFFAILGGGALYASLHPNFLPPLNTLMSGSSLEWLGGGAIALSFAFTIAGAVWACKGKKKSPVQRRKKPSTPRNKPAIHPRKPEISKLEYLLFDGNLGSNHDFNVARKNVTTTGVKKDDQDPNLTKERRDLAKKNFEELSKSGSPDFFLLQETGLTFNTLVVSTMLTCCFEANFMCINTNKFKNGTPKNEKPDTAIAWNSDKFTKIAEDMAVYKFTEINGKEREWRDAIVVLKETKTEQVLILSSGHIRGFRLNSENIQEDARAGNKQLVDLCTKLEGIQKKYPDSAIILGMDANTDIADQANRITPLRTRKNWTVDDSAQPTVRDANKRDANNEKASVKLDYVATVPPEGFQASIEMKKVPDAMNLDSITNPSDHQPILARLTFNKLVHS